MPKKSSSWMQSDFYRHCYHRFLNWLIVDAIIMLCLVAVIMVLLFMQQQPPYYASTLAGQVIPLTPQGG